MQTVIYWTQIVSAVLMILAILAQEKSAGLGGAIAGGEAAAHSNTRGIDRLLTRATVLFAIVFFGSALASLFV